jgi:aspartate-semialdehyde dehydrogenase
VTDRSVAWNVGVIGATGAVGRTMLLCLAESAFPVRELRCYASARSAGQEIDTRGPWGESIRVDDLACARLDGLDLVLLSAGAEGSRAWVPRIASMGIWAVDNSSAFRMDPDVPLIVPEVNADAIPGRRGAIANPNCSTIQMVVALFPLARAFGLRRVHVATYQSVSGRGQKGVAQLEAEHGGAPGVPGVFPVPIEGNVIPQCDILLDDGFSREEEKMIRETRKILSMPELPVHPTCVRVPVAVSHAEAVHVELGRRVSREELVSCLGAGPGLTVDGDPRGANYPTPLGIAGDNRVHVGRIRVDRCDPTIVEFWVVADNLRKGAAWNAVQIAHLLRARESGNA